MSDTLLDTFTGGHMIGKAVWFLLIILATFLRPATAEIYQWTDENGRTHFSDKKPVDPKSDEKIKIRKEKYKKSDSKKTNDDRSTKPDENKEEGVVWYDYTEGLHLSKKTGKGTIIIFYTDWCPICKKYIKLFDDPTIIKETRKFVMIRMNQDKHPGLSSKYDFDGEYIPRTFALSPDGNILHELYPKRSKSRYYLGIRRSDLVSFMKRFARAL
jgi:thiol-disulfide isomerase/thioredoxin